MFRSRQTAVLGAVLLLCWPHHHPANAFMPHEKKFDAPSLSIRGALKAAIDHDYEDVIVMQTEMAWGAQEMKRYKSLRGNWPVRSKLEGPSSEEEAARKSAAEEESGFLIRGTEDADEEEEIDYWTYLISIF